MREFVDLHTHSTASDGMVAPDELIRLAEAEKLAAVALTDHDTTAGLAAARAAAAELPELRFVAGIEVSATFSSGTLHVVGLGIDENAAPLRQLSARLRAARDRRNPRIVAKLQAMGVKIDMADVLAVASSWPQGDSRVVGRPHIAEAMRRSGCVATVEEAFDRYIGNGAPAYVPRQRPSSAEAVAAVRDAGGAAVLAHPVQLPCDKPGRLERIVRSLIREGLNGIEVYHTDHSDEQTARYLDLAGRLNLLVTGGSDFHGSTKPEARLGWPRVPIAAVSEDLARRLLGRT